MSSPREDRNPYLPDGADVSPASAGPPPPPGLPPGPSSAPMPPPLGQDVPLYGAPPPLGQDAPVYGTPPGAPPYGALPPPPPASPYVAGSPGGAVPYPAGGSSNGMATASFVCSVLLCFYPLCGILAVVFGHVALSQLKRTPQTGRGLAITGLVIGYVTLAFGALALITSITQASARY